MAELNKTPVSIVNELCQKKNMQVEFIHVSATGPPNDPVFVCRAETSTGLKAEGSGKKKKDAQQKAAQALLNLMNGVPPVAHRTLPVNTKFPSTGVSDLVQCGIGSPVVNYPDGLSSMSVTAPVTSGPTQMSVLDSAAVPLNFNILSDFSSPEVNTVGQVQEYCMKHKLKLPDYITVGREGAAHQPMFTVKCVQGSISRTATARTKQQAKHEAARLFYEELLKEPLSSFSSQGSSTVSGIPQATKLTKMEVEAVIETYSLCKPLSDIPKTNPTLKFNAYPDSMTSLLSQVKNDLKKSTFTSPRDTLQSLVEKLGLMVSYHEARDIMESNPMNERCYVYAIVNTQPTTVQIGEGASTVTAELNAALTVLHYWKTFLGIL